jgi:phosphoribosyl-dephospho-CoA transferase
VSESWASSRSRNDGGCGEMRLSRRVLKLSPRSSTMSDHARRMHARTNSHPEIQALLKRLMEGAGRERNERMPWGGAGRA